VLLPAWCLLRRADAGEVIGAALQVAAAGGGHRKIARVLGRLLAVTEDCDEGGAGDSDVGLL
jgi:hypothetical protein